MYIVSKYPHCLNKIYFISSFNNVIAHFTKLFGSNYSNLDGSILELDGSCFEKISHNIGMLTYSSVAMEIYLKIFKPYLENY